MKNHILWLLIMGIFVLAYLKYKKNSELVFDPAIHHPAAFPYLY